MNQYKKIISRHSDSITGFTDLTGADEPSVLFHLLIHCFGYLLDNDVDHALSEKGVIIRKKINFLIHLLGPRFLSNPQKIENRNYLRNRDDDKLDKGINLPDKPVIWTANHAFKDDTLATILAIKRHAYILFGSVPQFYNTMDGITAWLNGVVISNRKVKESKRVSLEKAVRVLEYGADLMIFPEGVWNKSPNQLLIDLWPGIYRIAKETGAPVVPVVHYIRDCANLTTDNPIHTVIDDPVKIDDLSEKAALEYIREILAYWLYLMMEVYGNSTREEVLGGHLNSQEAWESHLCARRKTVDRYDEEIEFVADYRPKWKINAGQVWRELADADIITPDNAYYVAYACKIIEKERINGFQNRF